MRRLLPVLLLIASVAGFFAYLQRGSEAPFERSEPAPPSPAEPRSIEDESAGRRLVADSQPSAAPRIEQPPQGSPWVDRNNEAAELLGQGRVAEALVIFEECHEAEPESDVFRRNLAEALVRMARQLYEVDHELEEAIEHLERVVELAPDREDADDLRRVLDRWKREAAIAADHATDESDYFELSYEATREDVYRRSGEVIAFLERTYGELRDWFQADPIIEDRRPRIQVVLYDHDDFDALTGLGDWAGGVFDGVVRISVEDLAREEGRWQHIARHELVHAFIHEVAGSSIPGWLNEGLAQWLDPLLRPQLVFEARLKITDGRLYPLEKLQGSLATWQDAGEIARAYAQSLALIDHIAKNYGEHVLREMIARGREQAPTLTFEQTAGVPLDFVVEDMRNYF